MFGCCIQSYCRETNRYLFWRYLYCLQIDTCDDYCINCEHWLLPYVLFSVSHKVSHRNQFFACMRALIGIFFGKSVCIGEFQYFHCYWPLFWTIFKGTWFVRIYSIMKHDIAWSFHLNCCYFHVLILKALQYIMLAI